MSPGLSKGPRGPSLWRWKITKNTPLDPTDTPVAELEPATLFAWIEALEAYARDWDATFENRPSYFTQEFWYLLVGCMVENLKGQPLTVSAACQRMKTGSNRTREERLKKAVDDGYLVKERGGEDGRVAVVIPTPKLESIMRAHFARTFEKSREVLFRAKN